MPGAGKALLVAALLVVFSQHADAQAWIDEASTDIAHQAANITLQYLQRFANASGCSAYQQPDAAALEQQHYAATSSIIQKHEPLTSAQNFVRIQLDTTALTAQIVQFADDFNREQRDVALSLSPTPSIQKASDIVLTDVSIPADARFTDLAGTGEDVISAAGARNGAPYLIFYRTDVFARANVTALPDTWEDLLALAGRLNGTDFDGDGIPDHAVCFNPAPTCGRPFYILLGILGPMMQAQTPADGVFFQPDSMRLLVRTPAMQRALGIYADLARFNSPLANTACRSYSLAFAAGKCAMTLNQDQYQFSREPWPQATGRIGTMLFPGSPLVLDRPSNTLHECTPQRCPMATPSVTPPARLVNHAPVFTIYRSRFITSATVTIEAALGVSTFWHYYFAALSSNYMKPLSAAMGFGDFGAAPAPAPTATPTTNQSAAAPAAPPAAPPTKATARKLAQVAAPQGAYRPAINPQPLLAMGYSLNDTLRFLPAFIQGFIHHNRVQDIAVPGAAYFRAVLGEAALNATLPGANLSAVMGSIEEKYTMIMHAFPDAAVYQKLYWSMIGYVPPPAAPGNATAVPPEGSGSRWKPGYTVAVALPCAVLLVAVLLGWTLLRMRHAGRTLLGAVVPPGVGPATTLLITDIQNSTVMWEQLPMALMEEVLRLHHCVLRSLLDKHNGYESATEGDSFILAFHSPSDALAYAVEAQQELLAAPWPQELLAAFEEARDVDAVMCSSAEVDLSYTIKRLQALASASSKPAAAPSTGSRLFPSHNPSTTSTTATLIAPNPRGIFDWLPKQPASAPQPPAPRPLLASSAASILLWCQNLVGRRVTPSSDQAAAGGGAGAQAVGVLDTTQLDLEETDAGSDMPSITQVARVTSSTLGWCLSMAWTQSDDGEPLPTDSSSPQQAHQGSGHRTRIWRGLRVRMGIHSGLSNPMHAAYNKASHRTHYSGAFAEAAKCVGDAGHGGQIVLSGSAFSQLRASDHAAGLQVLLMGEHVTKVDDGGARPLYQALVPGLEPRLQSFPPLRTKGPAPDSIMHAPIGTISVVFMNAIGVQTLMGWDAEVTSQALRTYHGVVAPLVAAHGGYVVELTDGLVLVAFQQPEKAIAWALASQGALMGANWPLALLEHELCEPIHSLITITLEVEGRAVVDVVKQTCSRGFRLKVGIDTGAAMDSIHAATGRMAYRGKVMNRAARVAAAASTGQVLCSQACWRLAEDTATLQRCGIVGSSTGLHSLKGIKQAQELVCCTYAVVESSAPSMRSSGSITRTRSVLAGGLSARTLSPDIAAVRAALDTTEGEHGARKRSH